MSGDVADETTAAVMRLLPAALSTVADDEAEDDCEEEEVDVVVAIVVAEIATALDSSPLLKE